jgi:16S rRNA (guanine966-N2)-methyltransferase
MRVIAGKFGGRKFAPAGASHIRPAADRVKGTIFNILQNRLAMRGIHVLDLYAGTGSLGIEAISRGATSVTFVDDSQESLSIIQTNIALFKCEPQCTIVNADAMEFILNSKEQYELIFADPPYAYEQTSDIPQRVFSANLLKKEGFLIIEHQEKKSFPESTQYRLIVKKEFGQTSVSFFAYPE